MSSSSVMPASSAVCRKRLSSRFHRAKRKFSGRRIARNTRSTGAEAMAKRSGLSLAMDLGETSPKISTTTVKTTVATVGPYAVPTRLVKSTVPTAVAVMLTMLFPMRMVESRRS